MATITKENEYFTGDDWAITTTLKKDGSAYDVSSATISAAVVSLNRKEPIEMIAATAQSSGTTGADWTNGVVVSKFAAAATALVTAYGTLYLEVQVTIGGEKETWPRLPITVNKGFIS